MDQTNSRARRRYAGLGAEERARQRRDALLTAVQDLFGTQGYHRTSVKQICTRASLTERYFYESFRDREAALTAVYDEIVGSLRAATLAAIEEPDEIDVLAERGLTAFFDYLTADERRARIVLIEVVGISTALETRRHAVLTEFAELVTGVWLGGDEPDTQHQLTAMALVGGVNQVLVDWLLSGRPRPVAELVRACATLFTGTRKHLESSPE